MIKGYKSCFIKVGNQLIHIQKKKGDRKKKIQLYLRDLEVQASQKDQLEFYISNNESESKKHKIYFKAENKQERDTWVSKLKEFVEKAKSAQASLQDDPNLEAYRDNLYDAFSSKLFVDDQDLDTKLQAFQEVEKMFKEEIRTLQEAVNHTLDNNPQHPINKKVQNLKNLSKTMSDLVGNIVHEVDQSRAQMFTILESIAAIEMQKNPKKFNEMKTTAQKRKKSLEDLNFQFEEEKGMERRFSNASETVSEFEFDRDQEEEMFEDAQEEIIITDQKLQKVKHFHLLDVYEERLTLPHLRPPNYKVSVWALLKDLIGKDLAKISMPVYFNEPLSMLQKLTETFEYVDLLDIAAQQDDSLMRLAYVAAYSVSRFSGQYSKKTKPFNPLLGETFELVTDKFRFFSEQVSHHPPITAFIGQSTNYTVFTHALTHTRFNGRNLVFRSEVKMYARLKLKDGSWELYSFNIPLTSAKNLILGTPYVDVVGKSQIVNHSTKEICELDFKEKGWNNHNAQAVNGSIKDLEGIPMYSFKGKWNIDFVMTNIATGEEKQLWKINPYPEQWDHLYFLSRFALQLNYLPDSLKEKLPHTDSRFRPDQRALEYGKIEEASALKHKLEEQQRARRKQMEESKTEHTPYYFEKKLIEETNENVYQFTGKYWEDRVKGDWSKLIRIFDV